MERGDQPKRGVRNMSGTERLKSDAGGIARAVDHLRAGRRVAFPTETVYGLGADARSDAAVAGIYAAKGRPSFNPLIVHVADADAAQQIARFDDVAERVTQAFWPGPLTIVAPLRPDAGISRLVTAGLDSVAIRVPDHPLAQALLRQFDGPLAAPSANPSGRVSPTRPEHVLIGLDGAIAAILDGGNCRVGLESTILRIGPPPVLLREGGIPREAIAACLGAVPATPEHTDRPDAPGQLTSHYAPKGTIRLDATDAEDGEFLIGFGDVAGDVSLSASGDLVEAASRLFETLHHCDTVGAERIAVAPIPRKGLGLAINDRLSRAAADR